MKKDKKFYIVFSRKEDGFWTMFKRAAVNPEQGDGFDTHAKAVAELNRGVYPAWYRFRIVEVMTPVSETVTETVVKLKAVWR